VYGRRRTGKTFLVKEFFKNRFSFYISGLANATQEEQLENFASALSFYGQTPYSRAKSWLEAFRQLVHLLENDKKRRKKVIFIDELPWFDAPRSGFITGLEWFWNSWASARPEILLIVCGSATSWMINKLLNNRGGLHNRVTHRLWLEPFTLAECEQFFKHKKIDFDRKSIVESYMVFGGIPFYLNLFEKGLSVAQNVDKLCFTKKSELKDEFLLLYSSLFKNSENYVALICALAKKKMGLTRDEIVAESGLSDGGTLSKMLEELEQCSFIRSYNAFGKKTKERLFQLIDFYSLFYLSFVKNAKQTGDNFWASQIDTARHRAWSGYAYEQVCLWHIVQIKKKLGISGVSTQVFSWRSRNKDNGAQIDLIIRRNDRVTNVCEIKFANKEFVIDKKYDEILRNKKYTFIEETKLHDAVHLTMLTTYGVQQNAYWNSVQAEVVMNDLFEK
jgi:AAA+ ATPase superfamily predicted ATPase